MSRFHDPTQGRTLNRLVLPARCHDPGDTPVHRGLYVDVETTGMDWANDDIVELGLLPFTYTDDGRIADVLHEEVQCYLSAPGRPLGAEVAARTGLTDAELAHRHIDVGAATGLILRSALLIAHNARHDRPFVERAVPAARERPWACSRLEVPWLAEGFASAALDALAHGYGAFPARIHRALPDCETGIWLLAQRLPRSGRPVLAALLEQARKPSLRLWAVGAPPEARGLLRARGYRWMPVATHDIPSRSWWRDLAPEMGEAERAWLARHVYDVRAPAPVVVRRVDALCRWRADPADCADARTADSPYPPRPGAAPSSSTGAGADERRGKANGHDRTRCGDSPCASSPAPDTERRACPVTHARCPTHPTRESTMHDSTPRAGAAALASALAERAEQVCRHYLSAGRKQGRYWTVGDVHGAEGRSLYVRLAPPGTPGRWTDAATGEHGDLLELIRLNLGAGSLGPALAEARHFLGQPALETAPAPAPCRQRDEAARRMWQMCRAVDASQAEAYLRARGIRVCRDPALRFHPALYYRNADGVFSTFPALVARLTDAQANFTGVQRTYLHPHRPAKAPVADARKALGRIHGHAVRLGPPPTSTLVVAEGIETALSLRTARPDLPAAAALSAAGLAAFVPPPGTVRLLIARDDDPAGDEAAERLYERCRALDVGAEVFVPLRNDFNDDLLDDGAAALAARIDEAIRR